MIRNVSSRDAKAIVDIYNEYVVNSVATFETEPFAGGGDGGSHSRDLGELSLSGIRRSMMRSWDIAMPMRGKKRQLINIRLRPPFIYPRDTRARGSAGSLWKG